MPKLGFVGAGNVGATAAFLAAQKELGDVVIVDIVDGMPQGKGLDMLESGPVELFDSKVEGSNDYAILDGADVVVVTAGIPRKPGMSREDLIQTNAGIIREVTENIAKNAPNSIIVMVTNPLDIMTYLAFRASGFPKNRVVGQAGILDSIRFKAFISLELGVSVEDIQTMVLGGHGDTMVPLVDYTSVTGIPLGELLDKEKIDAMVERTRKGGGEIVKLLKTGSAFYAPAAASIAMVESIVRDKKRLLPCSCLLEGEYGIDGIYSGVPAILGSSGVERIIELKLSDEDLASLRKSASFYKETAKEIGL